jgi:hypothetical protein
MNELSELRGPRPDPPLADTDPLAAPRARLTRRSGRTTALSAPPFPGAG